MPQIDLNSLDRVPTSAERWVGAILSAIIVIVCLSICLLLLFAPGPDTSIRSKPLVAIIIFGVFAIAAMYLFYRAAFTKSRALSHRAQMIVTRVALAAVALVGLLAVLSFAFPASVRTRISLIALFCVGMGHLANERRRTTRSMKSRVSRSAL